MPIQPPNILHLLQAATGCDSPRWHLGRVYAAGRKGGPTLKGQQRKTSSVWFDSWINFTSGALCFSDLMDVEFFCQFKIFQD
jgi:hypothetical protein